MENTKPWWRSKTIWMNFFGVLGSIVVSYGFGSERWAEITAVGLGLVNLVLRIFTSEGLSTGGESVMKNEN